MKEKQTFTTKHIAYITHHTQGEINQKQNALNHSLISSKAIMSLIIFFGAIFFESYKLRTIIVKSHLENLNFLELEAFIPSGFINFYP